MSLRHWVAGDMNRPAEPLTAETLNNAMKQVLAQSHSTPRHDCRYDGHVAQLASARCVHCLAVIRALAPDENRLLLGEFF